MSPLRSIAVISIAAGVSLAPDFAGSFGEARRSEDYQASRNRPDVIIVLTDQQRADAFGASGAADLRTPVMDRLAPRGRPVHPGLHRDAAVLALPGRADDRSLSSSDRGDGKQRRRTRRREGPTACGDVGPPRSVASDARTRVCRRRLRDGLLREVAPWRLAWRLRLSDPRLQGSRSNPRQPRRRIPVEARRARN